jgi:hypothetical protein
MQPLSAAVSTEIFSRAQWRVAQSTLREHAKRPFDNRLIAKAHRQAHLRGDPPSRRFQNGNAEQLHRIDADFGATGETARTMPCRYKPNDGVEALTGLRLVKMNGCPPRIRRASRSITSMRPPSARGRSC